MKVFVPNLRKKCSCAVYVLSLAYGDMTQNSKGLCAHIMFNSPDFITVLIFCKL
jgi:hypothetical protein